MNPAVLQVDARAAAANDGQKAFDIWRLDRSVIILRCDGTEQVLLGDGPHRIQFELRGRSLVEGPVRLRYELDGFDDVEAKLQTLHRLAALRRLGRFPRSLFPPERRAHRWRLALRAIDGRKCSASRREIAAALFGENIVPKDWDGPSDYLRSRLRRAITAGERLVNGGYRELLSS